MTFSFLTLFPNLIESYFQDSILKIAKNKGLIHIQTLNIRGFAQNTYKSTDFAQIGGGAGQVLCPQVICLALQSLYAKKQNPFSKKPHIVFVTPNGKPFSHNDSIRLAKKEHIAFVCGRYEGIDERAIEIFADEVLCIGDFIITGGELAALCMCDSIARQIPYVLGNNESLLGESFEDFLLEAPIFARSPFLTKKFKNFLPPSEYSKGNHSKIKALKNNLAICKTRYFRPDLFQKWKFTQRLK